MQVTIRKFKGFGDVLAYIGGLRFFLQLFFWLVGSGFTIRLGPGILARMMYIEKNRESDLDDMKDDDEIADKFVKIKTSKLQMLYDPIVAMMHFLCLKSVQPIVKSKYRNDLQRRAKKKAQREFDVIRMIKKVRFANDLWTNILGKEQQKLMKF